MELTKLLQSLFVQGPLGLLLNLVRLLFVLLFGALALIGGFIEWLCEFLKHRNFKEEEDEEKECNPPAPEPVMRRPDPCIYSQTFLASQGLPVTWDNPDIWMAKAATPGQFEPDSYHTAASMPPWSRPSAPRSTARKAPTRLPSSSVPHPPSSPGA